MKDILVGICVLTLAVMTIIKLMDWLTVLTTK